MEAGASNSKRSRGPRFVTQNACTECRKKRAKCDGETPCGRCQAQGVNCVYKIQIRQSKEDMRAEIEALRAQNRQSERVFAALVANDRTEQVLQQLRDGRTLEQIQDLLDKSRPSASASSEHTTTFNQISDRQAITNALGLVRSIGSSPLSSLGFSDSSLQPNAQPDSSGGQTWGAGGSTTFSEQSVKQEDMMAWSSDGPTNGQNPQYPLVGTWDQQSSSSSSATEFARKEFGSGDQGQDVNQNQPWTTVTNDLGFVEHLMALYFCWEYPTFASLSKEHFLEDFRSGSPRNCSPLLVNALLALGCRFSNHSNARTNPNDSNTAGDHFFAEASRLLEAHEGRHVLTTVQALGLMSIREASCGRSSHSLYLSGQSIRLATEMGLHKDVQFGEGKEAEEEHAVRSATFWGAFSLDQAWSLSIGRLPHFSRDIKLVTKPALVEDVEASSWVPYTDNGAPLERSCTQPSNVRSVFKTFCELSEIVHKSLYTLYAPGANVTSKSLMESYTGYLRWYEAIPTTLRLGHNFTPAVLFAHMYYHFAILLLFRPFIKLDIIGSGVSPRDMCIQAAEAISTLVNSYSELYTLRRTPSFVTYFLLTSGITHLIGYGSSRAGPDYLRQGIADLRDMASCHGFANRALEILRFLVRHWKVKEIFVDTGEEETDICRPISTSLNFFCPNISSFDLVTGLGPVNQGDNPLFWPFPLQGRPLLQIYPDLEKSGFRVLSE